MHLPPSALMSVTIPCIGCFGSLKGTAALSAACTPEGSAHGTITTLAAWSTVMSVPRVRPGTSSLFVPLASLLTKAAAASRFFFDDLLTVTVMTLPLRSMSAMTACIGWSVSRYLATDSRSS